jgi:glycosyltransferase involved in cell wall biosynthesis
VNILYIGALLTSQEHQIRFGRPDYGLAGNRRIECALQALCMAGHKVTVLSTASANNGSVRILPRRTEQLSVLGWEVPVISPELVTLPGLGGAIRLLGAAGSALDVARETRPDAVLCYNTYAGEVRMATALKERYGVPIIFELLDLPRSRRRGVLNLKPAIDHLYWKLALRAADAFTVVSEAVSEFLPRELPSLLVPGVLGQQLLDQARSRREPFKGAERTLGYFGGLSSEKGVDVLLEAVPHLPAPWKLVVTGSGPLEPRFQEVARQYPTKLIALGSVSTEHLYRVMCSVDAAIVPKERLEDEGRGVFPFKICEYICAGAHVISSHPSRCAAIDGSFIHRWDGRLEGLLTALEDAEPQFRAQQSARSLAASRLLAEYSIESYAARLQVLLDKVISGNRLVRGKCSIYQQSSPANWAGNQISAPDGVGGSNRSAN